MYHFQTMKRNILMFISLLLDYLIFVTHNNYIIIHISHILRLEIWTPDKNKTIKSTLKLIKKSNFILDSYNIYYFIFLLITS